ncbi:MAG TPA: methyltransferase domain-containing protein [Ardenticatenaceae bacterium]|nr:methyltransferase domain-containing protein [Ardenticatenaceae bacterium]
MEHAFEPRARWMRYLPLWARDRVEVNVYLLTRLLRAAAADLPGDSLVLDAGAGEGRFKPLFRHTRYVGVDLAVGDVTWDYSDLDAICKLEQLGLASDTFDAVVCTQVLEHVAEPFLVLQELFRVLKPGGKIILSAPQSWAAHQIPHDFFRYTEYGLRYLLEKAGFVVDEIKPQGGYFWFLSFQVQNLVYWLFSRNPLLSRHKRLLLLPRLVGVLTFQILIPLLLFYLDPLDHVKEETFGHVCFAHKPAPAT